jgi:hypothetical protein
VDGDGVEDHNYFVKYQMREQTSPSSSRLDQ